MLKFQGLTLKDVDLNVSVEEVNEISPRDIAIIGIGLDLPNSRSKETFWDMIRNGKDYIKSIPEYRKKDTDRYLSLKNIEHSESSYAQVGFLEEIDKFDYRFFNLSPMEACLMDPGQRLFLECSWMALEDAGYAGNKAKGKAIGTYVGQNTNLLENYYQYIRDVNPDLIGSALPGNISGMVASRISYFLDLSGPSMVVNTACSSSLVAVHLAIQALQNKDCEMALVGGVNINLLPLETEIKLGKSKEHRAYTFDDRAEGTSDGEGVAAVLLKPLKQAVDDGDNVYAVIKGSSINQDGRTNGITAPSARAQANVIDRAWKVSGINPETIRYIEAHGTATELGDPIEIAGVTEAFQRYTNKKQFCGIGSIKTNFGHLDAAAGVVGLIKMVLSLYYKEVPPSIHFTRPNRKIPFYQSPVYVQDTLEPWAASSWPRRCGISSFGITGTNAHVVLEEAPLIKRASVSNGPRIFTISSKSRATLKALVQEYVRSLKRVNEEEFANVCYTACTGRGHFHHRLLIIAETLEDLIEKLHKVEKQELGTEIEGVFYQQHNVVPINKHQRERGDLTEAEVRESSAKARQLLEQFLIIDTKQSVLEQIGHLYISGAEVEWELLFEPSSRRTVSLPLYPFERNRCWLEISSALNTDDLLYNVKWENKPKLTSEITTWKGPILLFKGNGSITNGWVDALRKSGASLITVEFGKEFKQIDASSFSISTAEEDFNNLMGYLKDKRIAYILYCNSMDDRQSQIPFEDTVDQSINSLFYLMKAVSRTHAESLIEIVLISPDVHEITEREEQLRPVYAAMFGLGKTITVEHPKWKIRCLDIDKSLYGDQFLTEIQDETPPYMVAYREGERYLQYLTTPTIEIGDINNIPIHSEGIYLITGGTGGIGLEIAKWLVSKNNRVSIVLINRTPFPERSEWEMSVTKHHSKISQKVNTIKELEKLGATIVLGAVDVGDKQALQQFIASLRMKYEIINGVIHCAGVPGNGMLWSKSHTDFEEVVKPKLHGTVYLDEVTKNDRMDFFVICSAMTAITGGFGQGDYASANAFVDAFAFSRTKHGRKTLALNWSVWAETGIGVDYGVVDEEHIFHSLRTQQAIDALEVVLNSPYAQMAVGQINHETFMKVRPLLEEPRFPIRLHNDLLFKLDKLTEKSGLSLSNSLSPSSTMKVELTGRTNDDYSDLEEQIGQIWSETMGIHIISIYDLFYDLGGDSIFATKIVNAIQEKMNLQISLVEFLQNLTIAGLADFLSLRSLENEANSTSLSPLIPVRGMDSYPVTAAQKRLYFLHELRPEQQAYNITMVLRVEGNLEYERLKGSFQKIVDRHEALRTYFVVENGELIQKVQSSLAVSIQFIKADEEKVQSIIKNNIQHFDLGSVPLHHITIIETKPGVHIFVVDLHHIISDGFSIGIIAEEFKKHYNNQQVPQLAIQFKDYAVWQNERMKSEEIKHQENFWLSKFNDRLPELELPTDFPRPSLQSFDGDKLVFSVDFSKTESLKQLASRMQVSMFMLLLATYNIFLARITGQNDIIVGSPMAGRTVRELEPLIGMFANTLAFRNSPEANMRFSEFISQVKVNTLEAYANQDYPLDQLIGFLGLGNQLNRNPLFDTMFVMHNEYDSRQMDDFELCVSSFPITHGSTKVDLTLEASIEEGKLEFVFEYCTDLFHLKTIEKYVEHFLNVLDKILLDSDIFLEEIISGHKTKSDNSHLADKIQFNFNF
ncbi:polyketide synthase PksN/surfactin family lipopeptide synthetase A [Paenibacillus sp. CF095]|uniref:SDR family NAD(P)-dependent oxidoreductase n=1 Tax=Paenibacillus sp. CF095 TaxID=1881033 RepID=UPI000884158C|nr:SDR family NAD(P)-dependent oxidoreductase [Paenibacillus sp. CF095]SDD50700.1 polyketide synthase PksN/surfactin family lipopeptide synthetase A [Paenibacillus sp. CF095]